MTQPRKDVLNGWKEIAAYLGRDPRTVERWEKQRSLPVRRLPGSGRATVYALTAELDAWLTSGRAREAEPEPVPDPVVLDSTASGALPVAPDLASSVGARTAEVPSARRSPSWLRGGAIAALVILACAAGLAGESWRKRHAATARPAGTVPEVSRLRKLVPPSPVPGVEQLYLRGSFQMELRTPESLHRAQDAFSAALASDPRYAPAWAGLASTYLLLREYSMLPDQEAYPKAEKAAGQALALDPEFPQAHAAMGFVNFFWEWNASGAEMHFREALQLDPGLALARHWYGSMLAHEGRFREALVQLDEAQRLDPASTAILTTKAFTLGMSGRKQEAEELLAAARGDEKGMPAQNSATLHSVQGVIDLVAPRNVPRFLAESTLAAELREDLDTVRLLRVAAEAYRAGGEREMWETLLGEEKRKHGRGGPTYTMARYEAALGRRDQALDDLHDLLGRHDPELIGISVDPLFVELRQEPRFVRLRASMNMPPPDGSTPVAVESASGEGQSP